ncbi:MAG: PAS domain S-box protein [Ferruginibacter sp.]|nr:PAS domain S-box protein [Ferruginibacter sp.]
MKKNNGSVAIEESEKVKAELQLANSKLLLINQELILLNQQLTQSKTFTEAIFTSIREPLLVLDKNLRVKSANPAFYKTFRVNELETAGALLQQLGNHQWNIPELLKLLKDIFTKKTIVTDFAVTHNFQHIGEKVMLLNATEIDGETINERLVLLNIGDISGKPLSSKKNDENQNPYHDLVHSSPAMIAIFKGPDMIIEIANDAILKAWGKQKNVIGKSAFETIPGFIAQGVDKILMSVYSTGEPVIACNTPITVLSNGTPQFMHFAVIYHAQFDIDGVIEGVAVIANDVTVETETLNRSLESERRLRYLLQHTPSPICILKGEEMILEVASDPIFEIWQVGKESVGKPILEIIPEMGDQPFMGWLLDVFHNGITRYGTEEPAYFNRKNGEKDIVYFNFVYQPYYEENGSISGVMVLANDVTEQVLLRKRIEDSEHRYQSMIYNSPSLISIFKGKDMIIEIANDAILESWGKGKNIIGKSLFEVLPETIQQGFDKLLLNVYQTGEPFHAYESPITLVRNGKPELLYYTFVYQAQRDINGAIEGVAVLASETTSQALLNQKLKNSEEQFRLLVLQAPVAICVMRGQNYVIEIINETMLEMWDRTLKESLNKPAFKVLPELKEQGFKELLDNVLIKGERFVAEELPVNLRRNGKLENAFVKFIYEPLREADGSISGVMALAHEITEQVLLRKKTEESQQRFENLIIQAPVAMALFRGKDFIAEIANQTYLQLIDAQSENFIGLPLFVSVPEAKAVVEELMLDVLKTGNPYFGNEFEIVINRFGKSEKGYFNFVYQPLIESDGNITGVVCVANEVTELVAARKKMEVQNQLFSNMLMTAPGFVATLSGPDHVYELVNVQYQSLFGKRKIQGKPIMVALPELKGQGFDTLLDKVYNTGEPYVGINIPTSLARDEGLVPEERYFNFSFQPMYNESGSIFSILVFGYEVTEQMIAVNSIKESEERFRNLADESPMFVFIIEPNAAATISYFNKTWLNYTGQTFEEALGSSWKAVIHPDDLQDLMKIYIPAFEKREPYLLPGVRVKRNDGEYRWHMIKSNPRHLPTGEFIGFMGVGIDIHEQKLAEEEVKRFKYMVENANDPFILMRQDGSFAYLNNPALESWGYTEAEAKQLRNSDVEAGLNNETFDITFGKTQTGKIPLFESVHKRKSGSTYPVEINMGGLMLEGKPHLFSVARDITDRKNVDQALIESETFNRSVLENSPDCVKIINNEGNVQFMNTNGMCIMEIDDFGLVKNKPWTQLWGEQNKEKVLEVIEKAMKGQIAHFQAFCPTTKGTPKWWDVILSPVTETGSNVVNTIISVSRDITESRSAQSLSDYRKALLEANNEASIDGILLVDANGKILSYNKRFIEIWNIPHQIVDAKNDEATLSFAMTQLINPSQFIEKVKWLYENPKEISIDELNFTDGKIIERHGYPVVADDGSYYAWSWTFRDVTEQRATSLLLEYRKALLEAHNQSSVEGILLADEKGKIISFNKRYVEMWNMPREIADSVNNEAIVAYTLSQLLNPEELGEKNKYIHAHPLERGSIILTFKDGKIVERNNYPVIGDDGNFYAVSLTYRDITQLKNAELALQKSEQHFRQMADLMPLKISNADLDGKFLYFNKCWLDYSGYSYEELKDFGYLKMMHPDEWAEFKTRSQKAAATGTVFQMEMRFMNKAGEYKWHLNITTPIKDENNNIKMWLGNTSEIQKQRELRMELENAVAERTRELAASNSELIKMNKELESFSYIASHDLQEPLRKIQSFSARLLELENEKLSDTGKDYFQRMQKAADRMQHLIQDLLAYSRSSTAEGNCERIHLSRIVEKVQEDIKEELEQKHGVIEVEELCEAFIIPFQFHQLLYNLISNSLKFSRKDIPPHIVIKSEIVAAEKLQLPMPGVSKEYCHISVVDNGIGFEPKFNERIFEIFQRLNGKTEFQGTGIGLAIVKKIVDNHHGIITASGELGKGARFDIYLPHQ